MNYQTRQLVTVIVLLSMAGLMGFVIGTIDEGISGAAIFDGGACESNEQCNDAVHCTIDSCKNPGQDNSFCSFDPIDYCLNDDGCCPRGCAQSNDNDC